jgi:hypothetical protein
LWMNPTRIGKAWDPRSRALFHIHIAVIAPAD